MIATEVVKLATLIAQLCPHQQFNEYTADVWYPVLRDVSFVDAQEAARRIGARERYIAPADIVKEVTAMRAKRLEGADASFPCTVDPDNVEDHKAALLAHRQRIADGLPAPERPALTRGVGERVLDQVFKRVPKE